MTLTELHMRTGYPLHELEEAASELESEGAILAADDLEADEWITVLFRLLAKQLGTDDVTATRLAGALFIHILRRRALH